MGPGIYGWELDIGSYDRYDYDVKIPRYSDITVIYSVYIMI